MRSDRCTLLRLGICALTAVMIAAPKAHANDANLPMRKSGHWELKTVMDEGNGPREQVMTMCVGGEMEANTVKASLAEHKQNCKTYQIEQDAEETVVTAECQFNGRHVSSRTVMRGDFEKAFNVEINSTTSDKKASREQTIVVQRTIKQTGRYLGSSCGDLKPGEAMAKGGKKIMVQ